MIIKRITMLVIGLSLVLPIDWRNDRFLAQEETQVPGLQFVQTNARGVLFELSVPNFQVTNLSINKNTYNRLEVSGAIQTKESGLPQLPVFSTLIGIPVDAQPDIEIVELQSRVLSGKYNIPLAPQPVPLQADFQPGEYSYSSRLSETNGPALDSSKAGIYPQSAVRIASSAWLRDQRILRVEVFPFQYDRDQKLLTWNRHLIFKIRFNQPVQNSPGLSSQSEVLRTTPFEAALRQNLINYDQARNFRSDPVLAGAMQPADSFSSLGPRYRIAITNDGLYRLSYETLQAAGFDVVHIDPTFFQIFNQGQEIAIYVSGNDGDAHKFSPGEYVLFYGQKFYGDRMAQRYASENANWMTFTRQLPDGSYAAWKPSMNALMLEKYTDENIYWLKIGNSSGLRMAMVNGTPDNATISATYRTTVRSEQQRVWKTTLFTSEETWFWNQINTTSTTLSTFPITLTAVASGVYTATLRGEVVSGTTNDTLPGDHHTKIYLNDSAHTQALVDGFWDGKSRYHFESQLPQSKLRENVNSLDFMLFKTPNIVGGDINYFDWYEIEYNRQFQAANDAIDFKAKDAGTWRYEIGGFSAAPAGVLDITSPYTPTMILSSTYSSGSVSFQVSHPAGERFYAGKATDLTASQVVFYSPPDLSQPADYLFITHHDFLTETQPLAAYRASQGLTVKVIDFQDLINEFNDGIYHPIAIKNYLNYTFANWLVPPTYAVLIGDGHWNFKKYTTFYDSPPIYMPPYLAWVDPWQGEIDTSNLLAAVVGDDLLPDLAIARMPVTTPQQLSAIITKTIAYETYNQQSWQRNVHFVADNSPDASGDFPQISDSIIADYFSASSGYIPQRSYLNKFINSGQCSPNLKCAPAAKEIVDTLNITGTLLTTYNGHAAIYGWAAEQVFTTTHVLSLTNTSQLPVILSMTCLDGYWFHPNLKQTKSSGPSLAEVVVRAGNGGAVATFSPTGLGVATGHDPLQRGFFNAVFHNGEWDLGKATVAARLALYAAGSDYDLIETFTLFGDPAVKLWNSFAFNVSPLRSDGVAPPGRKAAHTVQITNSSPITDTYELSGGGNGWTINFSPTVGPVSPGATLQTSIFVDVPITATIGSSDLSILNITSKGDRSKNISVELNSLSGIALFLPAIRK